jgi:replication-associated recombination protein RarA
LISENPAFLFDTIRSRCLGINFPVLTQNDIIGFINKYHPEIENEQAEELAESSFGSIDNLSNLMTEAGKKLLETHELMFDIFNNSLPPKTVTLIDSLIGEFKLLSDSGIDFVLRKTLIKLLQASFENEMIESNEYRERIVTDFTRFGTMYRRNINPRLLLINLYLNYREEYKKWKNRKIKA